MRGCPRVSSLGQKLLRLCFLAGLAWVLAGPRLASAAACCLSASVVGVGRLVVWEDAAAGLNLGWARGMGRLGVDGQWIALPAGYSEDELRAELWAIMRLAEPLQLSARVPWILGVRQSGDERYWGTGPGDVQAAMRWEAVSLGEYAGVPGIALAASVLGPTGRRPEAAGDPLGASATGRGAWTGGLGVAAEYSTLPWFLRLDVGGTLSAPFFRADTGKAQQFGPSLQAALSAGRELWPERLVVALALSFEHQAAHRLDGQEVAGSQSTGLSTALSTSLNLTPHWQLLASVQSDAAGRLGLAANRDERWGATLGVRHGFF